MFKSLRDVAFIGQWRNVCLQNLKKGLPMLLFNQQRASRFGVLPKDASSESPLRWFELPAMYAYHVANAWQEGSRILIFLCVYDEGVRSQPQQYFIPEIRA